MSKKLTTEEFILRSNQVHNNKYDYSKVVYIDINTKVCIICPEHGLFEQKPNEHLRGHGCKRCQYDNLEILKPMSFDEFVKKSNEIHGQYIYSKNDYIDASHKTKIICLDHGEFWQKPSCHLTGKGCKKCGSNRVSQYFANYLSKYLEKAKRIHCNFYEYIATEGTGQNRILYILCPKHGLFKQNIRDHLNGCGCPKCNQSKGEKEIERWLKENDIQFITQYKFKKCRNKRPLPFDFYLPKYNICIEYDGEQHFHNVRIFGGIIKLKITKKHDKIKNEYCQKNNIRLIRISYLKIRKISEILKSNLSVQRSNTNN